LLIRHGEAMSARENSRRPLSPAGREHVAKVADRVKSLGIDVEEILHSGKARARETAEIFAARAGVAVDRVRAVGGLKPGDDVEVIADRLEADGRSLALVGHLPFMGLLASRLLSGDSAQLSFHFDDAACLVASRVDGEWQLEEFINHNQLS
jgi:phosphohistidine phosphatase